MQSHNEINGGLMRDVVKQRILTNVFGATKAAASSWIVLIMDSEATAVISSIVGMYEIMEFDISTVESLSNQNRQALPALEAMYIVSPTEDAVTKISADFKSNKKAKYSAAHIFFLSQAGSNIINIIKSNQLLLGRLKALQEMNVSFLAPEAQVFDLGMPNQLYSLYIPSSHQRHEALLQRIAGKLVTLCVSLNEFPEIRYTGNSEIARNLSTAVHQKLTQTQYNLGETFWYHGDRAHPARERGTLLLLDRAQDMLSPLLHDFTYQANVYDVLGLEGDTVDFKTETPQGEQQRTAILGESDELWTELRHQHIAAAVNTVRDRVNDFMQNNAGAKAQGVESENLTMSDISEVLKSVPEYREIMGRLTKHLNITQRCMNKFEEDGLLEVIEIEQILASGVNELNSKVSRSNMLGMVLEYIQRPGIKSEIKARLVGAFCLTQAPISEEEKYQLYDAAQLDPEHQVALDNFSILNVDVSSELKAKDKKGGLMSRMKGAFKKTKTSNIYGQQQEFTSTRYRPQVEEFIEKLASNTLSRQDFPSKDMSSREGASDTNNQVSNAVSARKTQNKGSRFQGGREKKRGYTGARQIVCIIGGCTYTEMRAAYDLSAALQKEVIVGGTSLISPPQFLRDLKDASGGTLRVDAYI